MRSAWRGVGGTRPSRDVTANVVNFINSNPANLKFSINGIDVGADFIDIDIDISITHPFPGLPQYNGYDVRGVFMGDGSESLDYNPDLLYPVRDSTSWMGVEPEFHPSNAPEAIACSVIDNSNLYYVSPSDNGDNLNLDISVWDWDAQLTSTVMEDYSIWIESTVLQDPYQFNSIEMTPSGEFLWAASWGGNVSFGGGANDLAVDDIDNVVVAGYFYGTDVDFDPGPGGGRAHHVRIGGRVPSAAYAGWLLVMAGRGGLVIVKARNGR